MAKYSKRRTSARRRKKQKEVIWRLEIAAAVTLVCVTLCISLLGGRYGIPTWGQLYQLLGVSNASPAPTPAPPAEPAQAASGAGGTQATPGSAETQIHFIDVGQGDAVLIENSGEYALIDCGTEDCETALLAYLEQLGVTELKLLVMTHPHADHIGSMDAVIQNVKVELFLLPELDKAKSYPTTAGFERVLTALEQTETPVEQAADGAQYPVGAGTLTVLSTGVETDNYNNISVCTRYTAGGFAFVDTGDAEKPVEQALLQSGAELSALVFKAAHHGSNTSNSAEFLQAVRPQIVVVSCGLENSYGHPHASALESYAAVGAQVYRTDLQGSVVVTYTPENGLRTYTAKEAA